MKRFVISALLLAILSAWLPGIATAHELPLGDGHVTDHPESGNVYSCRDHFRGGGARHAGDWFHGDTWDPTEKPHVAGRVYWPMASFTLTTESGDLLFQGNGLPVNEPTGEFPISPSDPAYAYDTNPNPIAAQHLSFHIPETPEKADEPGCLPMGMIGFTVSGVAFYSALDDAGRDAAAHEIQDQCDGHPQGNSQYHYHSASPCIPGIESDRVVGWALDGYPILGLTDANGADVTNAELDACHGRAEDVSVDGRSYHYAYHLTREYPYTLGCFSGRVLPDTRQEVREGLQPSRRHRHGGHHGRGHRPPPGGPGPRFGGPGPY